MQVMIRRVMTSIVDVKSSDEEAALEIVKAALNRGMNMDLKPLKTEVAIVKDDLEFVPVIFDGTTEEDE